MEIIVPHRIKKKELGGTIPDDARKLFAKLKDKPEIAAGISARGAARKHDLAQGLRDYRGRATTTSFFLSTCARRRDPGGRAMGALVLSR